MPDDSNPSHDVLREQSIDQLKLYLVHGGLMSDYGAGDVQTEAEQLFDLVYETYVDAHTEEKVREARVEEMENVKLVTYREEMVRYADKRIKALTNKGKGDKS